MRVKELTAGLAESLNSESKSGDVPCADVAGKSRFLVAALLGMTM